MNTTTTFWDTTITLRKIRNYVLLLLMLTAIWYVWESIRLQWHSKMGGLPANQSPYYAEIPKDCQKFANRHAGFYNASDSFALRIRPIRLPDHYLQPTYGRIRCLGFAVLTGLHMQDPLDADFTDTYVDRDGHPIVRITVEYLRTYNYNPTVRKSSTEQEQK